MNSPTPTSVVPPESLPAAVKEQVLVRLGIERPEVTPEGLRAIYAEWCQKVPFDNVRKLIHVRGANPAPLPGGTAEDFFAAWLRFGTGGTCWVVAGALYSLLHSLGFQVQRGIATMLVVPALPPNHGTVVVTLDNARHLLDGGMLHGEPLRLDEQAETRVEHPAWGVHCSPCDGRWHIRWRPLHKADGLECRLETTGASGGEYLSRYEHTRGWSPFNYELNLRVNRSNEVIGTGFGQWVTFGGDGSITSERLQPEERARRLIEVIGLREEIVSQIPADIPTPAPPGTRTAQSAAS